MAAAMIDDVTGHWWGGVGVDCSQLYDTSLHNPPFITEIFVWIRIYQQFSNDNKYHCAYRALNLDITFVKIGN